MDTKTFRMYEYPPAEALEKKEGISYPEFTKYHYYSRTAERETPVNVLLPTDMEEGKKYPVLYILHGYWDNEDWMARDIVHISDMLGNLWASGEAEKFITVLPYNFTSKELTACTGMDYQNSEAYDNFINDFFLDLKPYIEENFPVKTGRDNTAVTGFSMGGREGLFIGLTNSDKFGYVAGCCPAPGLTRGEIEPWMLEESELHHKEGHMPEVVMVSYAELDGVVNPWPQKYDRLLTENGTEHLLHVMSKTGHDHESVTPHLYNYFRLIFRK